MNKILTFIFSWLTFCSLAFASGTHMPPKQYSIEQFLNTKNYIGGSFSFDEKRILYSSDESGIYNVYSIKTDDLKQTQLTFSKNQTIFPITSFPHDDRFLYASDESGNEIYHIYLKDSNGATKDLTPYPGARAEFHGWSHDFKSFYFAANARDPKFMDLYEMDIATFSPKLIYQNDSYSLGAVSPNKRYLSLHKSVTSNHSEIYLYDFVTKQIKNLTPSQDEIHNLPQSFSVDSQYLYFLTDKNSDFTYLKRYNIAKNSFEDVEKYAWDINTSFFSHDGQYRVTSINEDGQTIIKIFATKSGQEIKLPEFSDGKILRAIISKSSKAILFYVEGDQSSANLYVYDIATKTSRKLTHSLSPDINPDDLVKAEIVRYPSYDGTLIPALYYKPQGISQDKKAPALIWVHGGPGGQSSVHYDSMIQFLVNHGYAILAVNNRGSSGYGKTFYQAADHKHGEADLDDCIWAKKFLIGTGDIDGNKIGMIGGSYGGYMTLAALAFRPQEMAVGVDIVGVSNWVRTLKSIPPWWESERESLYKKIGNPYTEEAYLESISPLFHANNIVKPLLVLQGANDPRVLKIESDQIIEQVNKNGIPNQYVVFPDEGHGFTKKQNQITTGKVTLEFLDKYLS